MPLTVRIPELALKTPDLDLAPDDLLAIWIRTENKTKQIPLQKIVDFVTLGGGSAVHAPVEWGAEIIYKVPLAADGTDTAYIPSIAGLDFTLERGGFPLEALLPDLSNAATAEYEILDAGGFKLIAGDTDLHTDERFKLTLFSLIGAGSGTGGGATAYPFIKGKKVVATNTTLDPLNDINKVIQVRSISTAITITLPSVEDIPVNGVMIIETIINNTKPTRITGTGGQLFYLNGGSRTYLDMMPGETLWLYRDEDGFYILNDFAKYYMQLSKPVASYRIGNDEVLCKGQLLNRADYPRIFEDAQATGSMVSDATWALANVYRQGSTYTTTDPGGTREVIPKPYRGFFSTGDGTTTFRMPDLMNMALRGMKSETGYDTERYQNKPGGFQPDGIKSFDIDYPFAPNGSSPGSGIYGRGGTSVDDATFHYDGKIETTMMNTGVFWVMKK